MEKATRPSESSAPAYEMHGAIGCSAYCTGLLL